MEAPAYHIYPLGDRGLTIELGKDINATTNRQVHQLFRQLQHNPIQFVSDIIPAYSSVSIIYDTNAIKKAFPHELAFDYVKGQLIDRLNSLDTYETNHLIKHIPVCYDVSLAPDLKAVAAHAQISVEELIRIHTALVYTVYMIGFLPGFPYMASVDKKIQMPRKAQPQLIVPAGSVGIAGEQTGIYPLDSPGGWQLIGQTPLLLFDVALETPCLLEPGQQVQFNAISLAEFYAIKKEISA
ncbi:MAG: inhibitor of the autophosphorylation reaction of KinA [Chitinophagaceae bacterium]|nr:MAG: inhibitor of the autophosphorylation reaction of [Chitinophagaceae bacterium]TXT33407.1 MAG: inhibitor of the autophosphorylation reaction of KinA [Chitinophagaceae bacterium]